MANIELLCPVSHTRPHAWPAPCWRTVDRTVHRAGPVVERTQFAKARSSLTPRAADRQAGTATQSALASYEENFVCDEPVCTPAIAQVLRALAQDVLRMRFSPHLFTRDVKYNDGFRSFQGNHRYHGPHWVADLVQEPKVLVKQMTMMDSAMARVEWRVMGTVAGGSVPVDISCRADTHHNLLTGLVQTYTESWDLSSCPAPAQMLLRAGRASWAVKQAVVDVSLGLSRAGDTVQGFVDSMDESEIRQADPTDPTRFFQQEPKNAELWQAGAVLASIYFISRVWTELEKLH